MSQATTTYSSNFSEIISILKRNSSVVHKSSDSILIGSQAAQKHFRNFRDRETVSLDYDIICSSTQLIKWLKKIKSSITTIFMMIPTFNGEQLDLYVGCTLKIRVKYDFIVASLSTSYTVYLLNNIQTWTEPMNSYSSETDDCTRYASKKLLLILKKYMLYYSHQWQKTAKDYRRQLTETDPLTDQDKELCDLFIQYNDKLHGSRHPDTNQYVIKSNKTQETIVIERDEFLSENKNEQIACSYQAAKALAIGGDLSIGWEYICIKSPPWLADFVIDNWIDVQNEKFNDTLRLRSSSSLQCNIDNYRLFEELPELVTQKILLNFTDPHDFNSMKLVCKRWYTIFNQESFWQNLYALRYGYSSQEKMNWKSMYLTKMIYHHIRDRTCFDQLVDATIHLRRITANDVLRLWEDLTNQTQSLKLDLLVEIDYILSNSYYYDLSSESKDYLAKLVLIGFDHPQSQSNISINFSIYAYQLSSCSNYQEQVSVEFDDDDSEEHRYVLFMCYAVGGYTNFGHSSFLERKQRATTTVFRPICSRFPEDLVNCLFTMMIHPIRRAEFISHLRNSTRWY